MRATSLAALAALGLALAACKGEPAPASAQPDPETKEPAVTLPAPGTPPPAAPAPAGLAAIWDAPLATLRGEPTTLGAYRGNAVLVVNVASQCGLTPQYAALEAVHDAYAAKGLRVVGFPCNQFGGQEPGTAEEIAEFCATNYGISFPMMAKVDVNGAARSPVYAALTQVADASGHQGDIRWNFEKFLISADGTRVTRFSPKTTPDDPAVLGAIVAALP